MDAYIEVDGHKTWFSDVGEGDPVVLLHGGLTDAGDFTGNLDQLANHFRVLMPERRGHGRTPDVPGDYSLKVFADDVASFIDLVVGAPARLVGYSVGATVALQVAADRTDLVDRLVLISGAFDADGLLFLPSAEGPMPASLVERHDRISPDGPGHFPTVVAKAAQAAHQGAWPGLEAVRAVRSRTLVMSGDDDLVKLTHTLRLYETLSQGELAVLPRATHLLLHEHPDMVTSMVRAFLSGGVEDHRGSR